MTTTSDKGEPGMTGKASIAETLRKPFRPAEIGKLPRVTCPKCSDPKKNGPCGEHRKIKCETCGSYVSERHIHLDYVGHADVTSRLLEADPEWAWEPQARDTDPAALAAAIATGNPEIVQMVIRNSPPKFDLDRNGDPVGLWINLTVGGVTRPGQGSCPSGQNDAVKVLIGDALRNAAMRFGVAVDLWAKGDRSDPAAENATASGGQASRGRRPSGGEAFENAKPAQAPRPPAAQADSETDPDAQAFADEVHEARTMAALKDINTRAREAHKTASLIRNPVTGGTGGLVQYISWKKAVLEKSERALHDLKVAADAAGISEEETERRLVADCGHGIEDATAEEMTRVAELIITGAGAAA
jgi:hypothetical protein